MRISHTKVFNGNFLSTLNAKKTRDNSRSYIPSCREDETEDDMDALELVSAFHVGKIYAGNFSVENLHDLKSW